MNEQDNAEGLTEEIQGKLGQFIRVLMSYIDFQQASEIASYILENNLHDWLPKDRFLLQGLNTGMIVAYCRPFSNNRSGDDAVPSNLPERILKVLTVDEREIHEVVQSDRNEVMAHSDFSAWQLKPLILRLPDKDKLLPFHQDAHAPRTREATEKFNVMCGKLMDACFEERIRLEPELKLYLQVVGPEGITPPAN